MNSLVSWSQQNISMETDSFFCTNSHKSIIWMKVKCMNQICEWGTRFAYMKYMCEVLDLHNYIHILNMKIHFMLTVRETDTSVSCIKFSYSYKYYFSYVSCIGHYVCWPQMSLEKKMKAFVNNTNKLRIV